MPLSPVAKRRLGFVGEILLAMLVTGAIVTFFAMAPGMTDALKPFQKRGKKMDKYRLKRDIGRLRNRKLIETEEREDGSVRVTITQNGKGLFRDYQLRNIKIAEPKRWDRKWRIVCFDIPEERKNARDVLRRKLRDLGFMQVQKSVFVHPYPCHREITELAKLMLIQNCVKVFVAQHDTEHENLEKTFFS